MVLKTITSFRSGLKGSGSSFKGGSSGFKGSGSSSEGDASISIGRCSSSSSSGRRLRQRHEKNHVP